MTLFMFHQILHENDKFLKNLRDTSLKIHRRLKFCEEHIARLGLRFHGAGRKTLPGGGLDRGELKIGCLKRREAGWAKHQRASMELAKKQTSS